MATQNSQNNSQGQSANSLSTKQTIGAGIGILVLLGLLVFGTTSNEPAGAELITDASKPNQSVYQEDASDLNYEDALLKNYDQGTLLELTGKVNRSLDEPKKGQANVLVDLPQEEGGAENMETQQVMLVYADSTAQVKENQSVHLFGRYIGTLEFETAVGGEQEVPAIQVDYLSEQS
ncbi:MAG TPA: hypothetical protein VJ967_07695 [Clostridia bacterium]|nr:hypothetical protein [Clostridia bacterium]